ncbi:MAG: hypothetical protein JO108_14790 [Acidobacteriaceae bacterium]|nr:hypothetical protein [Acidobacteriaceae bacterium]
MLHSHTRRFTVALAALMTVVPRLSAADHGPVFGLATPTNPQGGWSFDLCVDGRGGTGGVTSALEAELSYGVTPNLKLAVSGPVVFAPDPYARSSVTANTPISGDFSGLAWWRFQKKDFAGKRFESTAVGGILVPGPQQEAGIYRGLNSGVGYLVGAVTGIASRSQYVWVGATYQQYAESKGDRRPDLLTYTAVYGYRPLSWRTDYPRWDWRILGEFTGEHAGALQRQMVELPGSQADQMFLGPSVLGVYRAIGIEAGIQFPVYRDVGPLFPKERYRFAINFAYFF